MSRTRLSATGATLVAVVGAAFAAATPASARDVLRAQPSPIAARAAAPPVTWCGSGPSPVDRQPSVEVSSPNQIHVVYAVPADATDRFGSLASPIATDIAAIDSWWQRQGPTRAPRFDLFPFPNCSSRGGL